MEEAPGLRAGLQRGHRSLLSEGPSSQVAVCPRLQASVWSVGSRIPTGVTAVSSVHCPSWVPVIDGHPSPLRSPPPQPDCSQEACRALGPSALASLWSKPTARPPRACGAASGEGWGTPESQLCQMRKEKLESQ